MGCCPECSKVNQDEEVLLSATSRSTKLSEAYGEEDFKNQELWVVVRKKLLEEKKTTH